MNLMMNSSKMRRVKFITSTVSTDQIANLIKEALPIVADRISVVGHKIVLQIVCAFLQSLWQFVYSVLQLVVSWQNHLHLDKVSVFEKQFLVMTIF